MARNPNGQKFRQPVGLYELIHIQKMVQPMLHRLHPKCPLWPHPTPPKSTTYCILQQYYIQLYIGAGYEKKHGQVSALSPPLTHYLHGLFPKFFFTSTLVNFHLANGGSQLLIPLLGYFFLQQNIRVDPRKSRTHNFTPVFKIFSC